MALTADSPLVQELGDVGELPVKGSTIIYEGSAVSVDASGYAIPLASGGKFVGFALRQANNLGGGTPGAFGLNVGNGQDGNITVRVQERGKVVKTITGVAATDVQKSVYATDSDTYSLVASGTLIGKLTRVDGTNKGVISYDATNPAAGSSNSADYATDGAIGITEGTAELSKGSAGAYTLAAPTAADEGKRLTITAKTAQAHTVTQTTPGFNGAGSAADVATFGGAIGDNMVVVAVNSKWNVVTLRNVTLG